MIDSSVLLLFKSSGTSTHLIKRLIKLDYNRYPLSLPIIWMVPGIVEHLLNSSI
jgi:hypothetical protein